MGGGGYGGAPASVPPSHSGGGAAASSFGASGGSGGFDAHDSSSANAAASRPHRSNSPFSSDSEHSDDDDDAFGDMAPGSSSHQASLPSYYDHGPHDPESSSYQDNFRIDDMGNPVHMTGPLLTGIYEIDTASDPRNPALIEHVVGRVYMLSKSQGGSRFVQQRLEDRDPAAFALFFAEMVITFLCLALGLIVLCVCVCVCVCVCLWGPMCRSLSLFFSILPTSMVLELLQYIALTLSLCVVRSSMCTGAARVRAHDGQFCTLCPGKAHSCLQPRTTGALDLDRGT